MEIMQTRLFNGKNLDLRIVYHSDFDVFSIEIKRINENTTHNLWGIFTTYEETLEKFNSIKL